MPIISNTTVCKTNNVDRSVIYNLEKSTFIEIMMKKKPNKRRNICQKALTDY